MQKCVKFRSKSTACRRYVRPIGLSLDSGFFSRRNFNEHRGRKNAFGLLAFHIPFLLSMLSTFRAIFSGAAKPGSSAILEDVVLINTDYMRIPKVIFFPL